MTNSKSWNVDKKDDQAWDDLFPHRTEGVGDYLNLETPEGKMLAIGSSTYIKVTTQRDETEVWEPSRSLKPP